MTVQVFDEMPCQLGEGVLWHPERQALFWFDILGHTLFERQKGTTHTWQFDTAVSAAAWIDREVLLIASADALIRFNIEIGKQEQVCALEADNPITRSNDGRADPWGGFWIGTMGYNGEPDAGAIYRYYLGELRQLFAPITISNAICFSPDRRFAYFTDTPRRCIWRQALSEIDGWPTGDPETFVDLSAQGLNPDGAVCDASGNLLNAQWGAARVAVYSSDGAFLREIRLPTDHVTCPGFGGAELNRLFVTSATEGLNPAQRTKQPDAGKTFVIDPKTTGQKEHRVVL